MSGGRSDSPGGRIAARACSLTGQPQAAAAGSGGQHRSACRAAFLSLRIHRMRHTSPSASARHLSRTPRLPPPPPPPPLAELDRREPSPRARLDAASHTASIRRKEHRHQPVFTARASSAYLRRPLHNRPSTCDWLRHLERHRRPGVNGSGRLCARTVESDAARPAAGTGLALPASPRVINAAAEAVDAAQACAIRAGVRQGECRWSGAGIVRDNATVLREAVARGDVALGVDGTALVQRLRRSKNGQITRVEATSAARSRRHQGLSRDGFVRSSCPADACQTTTGELVLAGERRRRRWASGLKELHRPRRSSRRSSALQSSQNLDVGRIEYLVDERDGRSLLLRHQRPLEFRRRRYQRHRVRPHGDRVLRPAPDDLEREGPLLESHRYRDARPEASCAVGTSR